MHAAVLVPILEEELHRAPGSPIFLADWPLYAAGAAVAPGTSVVLLLDLAVKQLSQPEAVLRHLLGRSPACPTWKVCVREIKQDR